MKLTTELSSSKKENGLKIFPCFCSKSVLCWSNDVDDDDGWEKPAGKCENRKKEINW